MGRGSSNSDSDSHRVRRQGAKARAEAAVIVTVKVTHRDIYTIVSVIMANTDKDKVAGGREHRTVRTVIHTVEAMFDLASMPISARRYYFPRYTASKDNQLLIYRCNIQLYYFSAHISKFAQSAGVI